MSYGPRDRVEAEELDRSECMDLLRRASTGRLAFCEGADVVVLPVSHGVDGSDVIFRTRPGSKLAAARRRARVGFEVDGVDEDGSVWSVLLQGVAEEIFRTVALPVPQGRDLWSPRTRSTDPVVRIVPAVVTGRRFRPEPAAATLRLDDEAKPALQEAAR